MTDVSTTCAVVIFRVKVSCITSVDGIILFNHFLMVAGNSTLRTTKKKMTTRNRGDEKRIWLFILCEKKTVYCCWIITDSPHVNAVNCKLYNVVSKRRNKLKYSYYRQHPAYFPQIYFEFLINSALPDSNGVCWQNFMDKILKIINFACVKYLVLWCNS